MPRKKLYEFNNYLINARFIHGVTITEYDIRQANISTLLDAGYINQNDYLKLSSLPKMDREVYIGKMIRDDRSVYNIIQNGITEAKKNLFEANNIQDTEVLRIANDAVYVIRNSPLSITAFNNLQFVTKSHYTTFMRLDSISILFSSFLGDLDIDVIGISREKMELHQDFMLNFIGNLLYMVDSSAPSSTIEYYNKFYDNYINRRLDIGYYRSLNAESNYILSSAEGATRYGVSMFYDMNALDIGYNAKLLRDIYSILAELYSAR